MMTLGSEVVRVAVKFSEYSNASSSSMLTSTHMRLGPPGTNVNISLTPSKSSGSTEKVSLFAISSHQFVSEQRFDVQILTSSSSFGCVEFDNRRATKFTR